MEAWRKINTAIVRDCNVEFTLKKRTIDYLRRYEYFGVILTDI